MIYVIQDVLKGTSNGNVGAVDGLCTAQESDLFKLSDDLLWDPKPNALGPQLLKSGVSQFMQLSLPLFLPH